MTMADSFLNSLQGNLVNGYQGLGQGYQNQALQYTQPKNPYLEQIFSQKQQQDLSNYMKDYVLNTLGTTNIMQEGTSIKNMIPPTNIDWLDGRIKEVSFSL